MFFTGKDDYNLEQIRDIFLAGNMGHLIHKELVLTLTDKENELIREETKELVEENSQRFGGSPIGFFYKGKLFAVAPTFKESDIRVLDSSLEQKAQHLLENRTDIPQYTTYIAHFLSFMNNHVEDPVTYVANMPRGLSKFSRSLKRLEGFVEQQDPDGLKAAVFNRGDPEHEIYFLHFDRVNDPLNRFLFRRITN